MNISKKKTEKAKSRKTLCLIKKDAFLFFTHFIVVVSRITDSFHFSKKQSLTWIVAFNISLEKLIYVTEIFYKSELKANALCELV